MNDKALAVQAEQDAERALAALLADDENALLPAGLDRLDPGDTGMPPRLRISQPNRPIKIGDEKVDPGMIVNTLTGDTFRALEIVVLVFLSKTRVMWPSAFNADNAPECLSDDGKRPSPPSGVRKATNPQAGPCETCGWAQFGEDGAPPRCKVQRNFLVWLVEQAEPAILTLQSTALRAARNLTTLARTKGLRSSVMFVTQEIEDGRGSWVVPAFTNGSRLSAVQQLAILEARDELKNLVVGADVEQDDFDEPVAEDSDDERPEIPF